MLESYFSFKKTLSSFSSVVTYAGEYLYVEQGIFRIPRLSQESRSRSPIPTVFSLKKLKTRKPCLRQNILIDRSGVIFSSQLNIGAWCISQHIIKTGLKQSHDYRK